MKTITAFAALLIFTAAASPVAASAVGEAASQPVIRLTPPAPKFTDAERQAEFARRRAAVAAKMADNSTLVLFSAEPKLYTNDVDYVFRQENNLFYLTGLAQVGATLVIAKDGAGIREFIFLPKRDPQHETWNGKMYSNEQASNISGIKTIVDAADRDDFVKAIKEKRSFASKDGVMAIASAPATVYMLLPYSSADENGLREFAGQYVTAASLAPQYKVENARPIFNELRHIKSPYEIAMLQHAIDITTEAQMRSMAMVGRAKMEYEVQAEVEYTFRRRNADFWGYPSIVGCGSNATTLHYEEASGPITPGNLILMDVGAEYQHYTADVTRTFPVNGKFTKEQAEIYQIVYDAQEAVAKATKPGATMQQLSEVASTVIKDGLFRLGLITDKNSDQYRLYYMHGLGHWLGMNVHDVGSGQTLKAGMVFTNEPGIYIREDALDYFPATPKTKEFLAKVRPAFEKYKNIGVRIEDDMLVTDSGVEWMTKNLPRRMDEIESIMARAQKESDFRALSQPRAADFITAPTAAR
ncbi:MAG: aminopeptidase P family protein [Acidobacteriota bacterium]